MLASERGFTDIVQLLLDHTPLIDIQNNVMLYICCVRAHVV